MRATVTVEKDFLDELVDETGHNSMASAAKEAISHYLSQNERNNYGFYNLNKNEN